MMKPLNPYIGSLEQYRGIIEEIDDIILILNMKGEIEYVNRALRRHLGYKSKRFTGRSISECELIEKSIPLPQMIEKIFTHRDFLTRVKKKQVIKHYAWRTKTFLQNGQKKTIAVIRDMTTQLQLQQKVQDYTKNLEEMVLQRTQQLEKEKRRAIELHQAKVVFMSKMSHELRTPLTAIRGYAELLQENEEQLPQEQKEKYFSVIEKNAKHLLDMVTDTLQMIQMEQNKFQIQEKSFRLKPFLEEIIETYTVLAKKKGLTLEYQIHGEIPEKLYSDPNAIRQILTNLIGNSLKFTEKGKIVLGIKTRTLPHNISSKLYFSIEDTGLGIPPDQHQRIFKTFEQYLDHQSTTSRGTGLGLPISRQLAKLLGGEVKLVSSEPFQGSTFVFTLPVKKIPHSQKKE
jgi:PAS domain S-box-containing protein